MAAYKDLGDFYAELLGGEWHWDRMDCEGDPNHPDGGKLSFYRWVYVLMGFPNEPDPPPRVLPRQVVETGKRNAADRLIHRHAKRQYTAPGR